MIASIEDLLAREEGEVLHAYQDSEGFWTIGVGVLIDQRKGGGITQEESRYLLANRINKKRAELNKFSWFPLLDEVRQAVCISMSYQVGDLSKWPNFCNSMGMRDYLSAANHMLDSKVAKEQAPARWQRAAQMMRTGQWI